ncbi:MAG: hypothetical protein Q8922_04995 [Bacteroidota bacterium]|nr:hypothetical protein [Bacteroidota bacterium]MDP4231940.1 hypothetical protein [Bacteroidota bacterium]MDP4241353.1 hypothetical protein [Bacteroidota bacterium]MDP4287274.1 hypothetical protein [Bacteroidota bacterium]
MRIEQFNPEPICLIPYRKLDNDNVVRDHEYPVFECRASGLPEGIEAIVCTSDLQGVHSSPASKQNILSGVHVASSLRQYFELHEYANPQKTLAVLAGDFYTELNLGGRGGFGYADEVWQAFASAFGHVVGVAGNHDDFRLTLRDGYPNLHLLHDEDRRSCGLKIDGIGGIIGHSTKLPMRHSEAAFTAMFHRQFGAQLDILVMHDNPERFDPFFSGLSQLAVGTSSPPVIIFGHRKLREPLRELENGVQLLSVNERVVILTRVSSSSKDLD